METFLEILREVLKGFIREVSANFRARPRPNFVEGKNSYYVMFLGDDRMTCFIRMYS